jgi:uncharacterized coiled-coil DUF342 family protein
MSKIKNLDALISDIKQSVLRGDSTEEILSQVQALQDTANELRMAVLMAANEIMEL